MIEHATRTTVHPEVLADLRAIRRAKARGELRGMGKVRVIRDAQGGRRVAPAEPPRSAADRRRRLQEIEQEIEHDMMGDRERRLAKLEAEVFSREERLARAEAAVDYAFASGRVNPTLLPPGLARVRLIL